MKKFLNQIGLFLLLLTGVFLALELPVQMNYHKRISNQADWQCLEGINAEVLIIGNSRAWTGFDASKIEVATGLTTYVLAQDGWQIDLLRIKLRNYLLVNDCPDVMFVQADPSFLATRNDWYDKAEFLKYLFLDRERIRSAMRPYLGFRSYEFFIPFIRYAGFSGRYVRDAFALPRNVNRVKGFKSMTHCSNELGPIPYDSIGIQNEHFGKMEELFCQCATSKEVALFPLVSDEYYRRFKSEDALANYCRDKEFELLNINGIFPNPPDSIFYNHEHADEYGAQLQTDILIDFLLRAK